MASKLPPRRSARPPLRKATNLARRYRPALEIVEPRRLLSGIMWFVNSLTDTGSGSSNVGDLRYCITEANLHTGDIIITASGTDTLGSSLPALTVDSTITDSNPGSFVVQGGGPSSDFNALTINSGVTATIDGLDFTNFHSSGTGGILDVEGTLTLDNSDLGNSSASNGGAVFVDSEGYLTTDQTNFHDDSANGVGGALFDFNSAVLNGGSFLNNNASDFGGAGYNGGYLFADGVEFAGNLSETSGGAIYSEVGMGVVTPDLLIENSTIDSNTALSDGGGIASDYSAKFTDDTIANNLSGSGATGAGYYNANSGITPGFYNTIVAQNFAGAVEDDVDGSTNFYAASSYNLIGNTTLGGISDGSQGNQIGTSVSPLHANLAARANNGGDSDTLAPTPGSPALGAGLIANAVDLVTGDPLPYDQRGVGFPRVVNDLIDIGAFQTQTASTSLAVSGSSGTYGGTTTVSATLTSGGSPVSGEMVDFHIGATDLGDATTDVNGLATLGDVSFGSLGVGTYTNDVTASFAGDSNYATSNGSADLTVTPAPLTITADSTSKTYGATVTFAGTEFTVSPATPLFNSDTVTGVTLSSAGAAATADVAGSPYSIVASAATGSGLGNYDITYDVGNLTVTPAPLTITADSTSKTYGATVTFTGTEFTTSTLYNSDTVTGVTLEQRRRRGHRRRGRLTLQHRRLRGDRLGPGQLRHHLRRREPDRHAGAADDHRRLDVQDLRRHRHLHRHRVHHLHPLQFRHGHRRDPQQRRSRGHRRRGRLTLQHHTQQRCGHRAGQLRHHLRPREPVRQPGTLDDHRRRPDEGLRRRPADAHRLVHGVRQRRHIGQPDHTAHDHDHCHGGQPRLGQPIHHHGQWGR